MYDNIFPLAIDTLLPYENKKSILSVFATLQIARRYTQRALSKNK